MFLVKKILSSFLMPFPVFLMLLAMSLFFRYRGRLLHAKILFYSALLWITLLSYPPFAALLLSPLENSYQKVQLSQTPPAYIHVLGSGHTSNTTIPLSSELGSASLVRVVEGVSIYKSHPDMKLIFSGYGGGDPISNARKNSQLAILMGVKSEDITLLEEAKDTHEEALAAKKIIGNRQLVLVTSASHMPRAAALFTKAGIDVIAAPTDFQVKKREGLLQFPSATGLQWSETAFHEYLGLAWGKTKGYL